MRQVNTYWLQKAICGRILSDRLNARNRRGVSFITRCRPGDPIFIVKVRNGTLRGVLDKDWDENALAKYKAGRWHERLDDYIDIWFMNGKVTDFDAVNSYADIADTLYEDFGLSGKDEVLVFGKDEYEFLTAYDDTPSVDEMPALEDLIEKRCHPVWMQEGK